MYRWHTCPSDRNVTASAPPPCAGRPPASAHRPALAPAATARPPPPPAAPPGRLHVAAPSMTGGGGGGVRGKKGWGIRGKKGWGIHGTFHPQQEIKSGTFHDGRWGGRWGIRGKKGWRDPRHLPYAARNQQHLRHLPDCGLGSPQSRIRGGGWGDPRGALGRTMHQYILWTPTVAS